MTGLLLLGLGLIACSPSWFGGVAMEAQARKHGIEEGLFESDSAHLRYWKGGSGPPLLMIHGFGGTGLSTWAPQLGFSDSHTLLVPDLLWFGGSHASLSPSVSAQVETLLYWMDDEGIEKVDVVGVSYGGFVALHLAYVRPDRVGRVVLVDSPGHGFPLEDERALCERAGVSTLAELFVPDSSKGVQRLFDLALAEPPQLPRWVLRDLLGNYISAFPDEQTELLAELQVLRTELPAGAVSLPDDLLVVWGRQDQVFPLARGEELAAAAGAPLHVIEEGAHACNIDEPEEFNAVVSAFLASD